jgi:hypothetical protein
VPVGSTGHSCCMRVMRGMCLICCRFTAASVNFKCDQPRPHHLQEDSCSIERLAGVDVRSTSSVNLVCPSKHCQCKVFTVHSVCFLVGLNSWFVLLTLGKGGLNQARYFFGRLWDLQTLQVAIRAMLCMAMHCTIVQIITPALADASGKLLLQVGNCKVYTAV